MQFPVVVLLPHGTHDIVPAVTRLMDPYNAEHEVPPYKDDYDDPEGIARLAAAFGLPSADPQAVAAKINERGDDAGIDDRGLYEVSTLNPQWQWDGWILHSVDEDVYPVPTLPRDLPVYGVLTPDGQWREFFPGWDWPEEKRAELQKRAYHLIDSFPDCLAVMLDCHR
jgi:hypothetical protein